MNYKKMIHLASDEIDIENMDGPEFMPLLSQEEENEMNKEKVPEELAILPIRNTVLFPGVIFPISVGRDKSIKLVKQAYKGDKKIGVVSQKKSEVEDPGFEDLYEIGTLAHIVKMLRMPDGNITLIIQGKRRIELKEPTQTEPFMKAKVKAIANASEKRDKEFKAMMASIRDMSLKIIDLSPNIPSEASFAIKNIESDSFLINFVSGNLNINNELKQAILESATLKERAKLVLSHLDKEIQELELKDEIQNKVRLDMDKQQKEYFLQQQIRAIQEELGQDSPDKEIQNLRARGKKKKWSSEIDKHFNKELDKLSRINPAAPDYSVSLNYAQLLLDLPWNEYTKDNFDLKRAKKVLDNDHYGLEKVKDRILEYLATLKLKGDMKSPIICLYGPPGVGKTSLGKSIARALNRKYVRMSLGGMSDESEIRGHRKTYIGAMPGRIMQNIKKAKSSNPVFVLDEIDKLGRDFKGDPSSALLETLDPEQNATFYDNYIEVDYDLSKVMFIATANSLDTIQPALLDRMEIIDISGYTVEEKVQIGKKHLLPKQIKAHGLEKSDLKIEGKVLSQIVEDYTRESGVRSLDKKLASVARNTAKCKVMSEKYNPKISGEDVERILGSEKIEKEMYNGNDTAGVVTGLAWSSVGGSILFVESTLTQGKGKLQLTGQLGDVMKESASTAYTYLKSNCNQLNLNPALFDNYDLHIHFPAGSTPKDGPSAGITILTSLASLYTQRKVKNKLAMTGEITLRGKVLPVGGIKEKILAAKRAGIAEILMSTSNKKDIDNIPAQYLKGLKFTYVDNMQEVLDNALLTTKVTNPRIWNSSDTK